MMRTYNEPSSLWKHLWQLLLRAGALSCALALFSGIAGPLASVSTAQAAGLASNQLCTTAKRGLNLALPAVVRIVTTYQAQISYITSDGSFVTFPQNGSYYSLIFSGSGAFIAGTGDILTTSDVIDASEDDLGALLIQQAAPDIAQAIDNANPPQPVTTQDIETQLTTDPDVWQGYYQTESSAVYLSTQYSGTTDATLLGEVQGYPIDTPSGDSAPDQSGLALLHADGLKDMPTISLGDSSQVFQGDTLTIIGYPGSADLAASDGSTIPDNFLTSSVNTVTVSAIKTDDSGLPVIQVDGNVEQGNSGGPALNADGQLVGVVNFTNTGQSTQDEMSFLQPVNTIKDLIRQASIKTTPDTFDQRWVAAYDTCASSASGHWHKAYQQYQQIARLYPDFKGVQLYLDYTKAQAAHEPASGLALPVWAWVLIGVVVLALVLAAVFIIRRRVARARVGTYAGYGPGLSKGAPYGPAAFSLGQQPGPAPVSISTGPSEQVGTIPPPDSAPLMPQPVSSVEPVEAWASAPTAPAITPTDAAGTEPPTP